jgi:hypothetical protein
MTQTTRIVKDQASGHLEAVAHHPLDAQALQFGVMGHQLGTRPHDHVVSQSVELRQDLLGFKTLLIALIDPNP